MLSHFTTSHTAHLCYVLSYHGFELQRYVNVINIGNSVKIGMQVCSFKWCLVAMMMMTAQSI